MTTHIHIDTEAAVIAAGTEPQDRHTVTPLPEHLSARSLVSHGQCVMFGVTTSVLLALLFLRLSTGLGPPPVFWCQPVVATLTCLYVLMIAFKSLLVLAAPGAAIIDFTPDEAHAVPEHLLPSYTVLVPLYREDRVLPSLIRHMSRMDYPVDRRQILLLVEEDDDITLAALAAMDLSPEFEIALIPERGPRTKPKACNVGLERATGKFCVIYDAEDRPDPDQLRKAVAAFHRCPDWVVCVQAELQYWNPWTNWLTRCFAAEYALNFALTLRGLDRFRLPIPLGGTSNHFRVDALRALGGWDPHNVTEDADLGVRLARRGWSARMMESITLEEANSELGNWIRQRSRWIKGYIQTWLVHMRNPWQLFRQLGPWQFVGFQLTFGFGTLTTLVNPIFWLLSCFYLVDGPDRIAALYPPPVLYAGVATMLVGNLLMVHHFMTGCMDRGLHRAVPTMLLTPVYWALMSVAAYKALAQLARPSRRHYWELTRHGLVPDLASVDP